MSLQLFDTLTDKKAPFTPEQEGHVRLYLCGPTTYDHAHIGHARPVVVYDVLVRHLKSRGFQVTYVRNVTDVDDKIINRARDNKETPSALAERMFESYERDMMRLHTLRPTHQPRVSDHVPQVIALVERLIERGHAYESQGDVYFHVASCPSYGKLSHRNLEQMEAGASERTERSEADRKRHPYDFALWKASKEGEPSWPSPWGPGRPGWHIECSAMSIEYLGETFDLHGGGLDLVFPHHENEIAQSECATGKCFARHWMHNGFVQVNKEKMSKSVGNFFRLQEAFDRAEPEAVRYSLLTVHYRAPYNLEMDLDEQGHLLGFPQFRQAEARLEYLYATKERLLCLGPKKIKNVEGPPPREIADFEQRISASLDDDVNTAQALAHLAGMLKATNELIDQAQAKKGSMTEAAHRAAQDAFRVVGEVLGFGLDEPREFLERVRNRRAAERGIETSWVTERIARRAAARSEKDFAKADAVRAELLERGVELLDAPEGTTWRLAD